MEKILKSKIAKMIVYAIIPFIVINIFINTFAILYYADNEDETPGITEYVKTNEFKENYLTAIFSAVNRVSNTNNNETNEINYNNLKNSQIYILIIDKDGKAYTNIEKTTKTDSLEELEQYIRNRPNVKNYIWIYENNEILTNIPKLEYEEIAYESKFEYIQNQDVKVYTSVKDLNTGEMYIYNLMYKTIGNKVQFAPFNVIISTLLFIACIVYIILSIGHKNGYEGIYTNKIDKISLEIIIIVFSILLLIESTIGIYLLKWINIQSTKEVVDSIIMYDFFVGVIIYTTLAILGVTIIRRWKAKVFLKNTLIYKITKYIKTNTIDMWTMDINSNVKLTIKYIGFIVIQMILLIMSYIKQFFFFILLILWWYYILREILQKNNEFGKIRNKINQMYNGEVDKKLDEEGLTNEFKQIAVELNDISGRIIKCNRRSNEK